MPRYYFDIHDGDCLTQDETGLELDSLQAAQDEAVAVLPCIALERMLGRNHWEIAAVIRDAGGCAVFRATLTFDCAFLAGGGIALAKPG